VEDEAEAMRRVAAGDAQAYRALSDRHLPAILRYATRMLRDRGEAEDVAQETFLRLWTHADRWRPKAKLSTWLHRIAHNLCIDRLRARKVARTQELAEERIARRSSPSGELARLQLGAELQDALDALPERQRAAIVLVHCQGMRGAEAAQILDVSAEAVESLLARGRRTMRETLGHLREDETEKGTR
jgi:RNA polymerase sigma-70 factor (ECF subfamily)